VLVTGCPGGGGDAETTAVQPAPTPAPASEPAAESQPEASAESPASTEELPATFGEAWWEPEIAKSFERKIIEPGANADAAPVTIAKTKGNKVLLRLVNGDSWTIIDPTKNFICKYDPGLKVAVVGPLDGSDGYGAVNVPTVEVTCAVNFPGDAKILRQEVVDDVPCYYAEVVPAGKVKPVKVWLDVEYGLLRKQEDERGVTRWLYSRLNEVNESEFAVPQDVKVLTRAQLKQATGGG
jgi:hypothetical protein